MLPFEPLPFELLSADEIALAVAGRARTRRLQRGWTQVEASERSGMTLASYKRFERTGEIAFKSLLKVAVAVGQIHQFESLFELPTFGLAAPVASPPNQARPGPTATKPASLPVAAKPAQTQQLAQIWAQMVLGRPLSFATSISS